MYVVEIRHDYVRVLLLVDAGHLADFTILWNRMPRLIYSGAGLSSPRSKVPESPYAHLPKLQPCCRCGEDA